MNVTLLQMLYSYSNENRDNWDDNIPYVLTVCRSTFQENTSCSPNHILNPVDHIGNPPSTPNCPVEYIEWLKAVLAGTYNFVSETLRQAAVKQNNITIGD